MWLIFRNIEKLPALSGVRLSGILLVYINLLVFMHVIGGGGRPLAAAGQGGGYTGWIFETLLTNTIGTAGAVVALIAWLLIALALAFDLSLTDLFGPLIKRIRHAFRDRPPRFAGGQPDPASGLSMALPEAPADNELPPDFRPLAQRGGRSGSPAQNVPGNHPQQGRGGSPAATAADGETSNQPPRMAMGATPTGRPSRSCHPRPVRAGRCPLSM